MKVKTRRYIMMLICIIIGTLTLVAYLSAGESGYDARSTAKEYILENHSNQTGATNAVTAIYLNYRLWDTLFEAMVLLLSALAVVSFSWSVEYEE